MIKAIKRSRQQESSGSAPTSAAPKASENAAVPEQEAPESEMPTLDAFAARLNGGGKGGSTDSAAGGGGASSGGVEGGVDSPGVKALASDVGPIASVKMASEESAPEEISASSEQGVGGGPIDYIDTPDPPAPPPPLSDSLGELGATAFAQDVPELGAKMSVHLDDVAAGQPTGGSFHAPAAAIGEVHTDSTVSISALKGPGGDAPKAAPAEGREASERAPEHYAGTAPFDKNVDTSNLDVDEGPATPPARGDWSGVPGPGQEGYGEWMMAYQMWSQDCSDMGPENYGNNSPANGALPGTNDPGFEYLWMEYRLWWDRSEGAGEPSAEDLATLNSTVGGVAGTDEEMRFDPDSVSADEHLQAGADPSQVDAAASEAHGQADGLLSTANADADRMRTEGFAGAEAGAGALDVDLSLAVPDAAVVASPERPAPMEEYLGMLDMGTVEPEVADGFDERMAPAMERGAVVVQEQVDGAVTDFEVAREDAVVTGESDAAALAESARQDQDEAVGDAYGDTDEKKQDIRDRQERAVDDAKAQIDAARDTEVGKIETERGRVQGQVDGKLADAEKQVDVEVEKGKIEADKKRDEGEEKKKKKRKWWQKLWDFVQSVVKWIVDQIQLVFDAVRTLVNAIVQAVVEAITTLIDALRDFVVGLIESLVAVLSDLIEATLGQVFPELAAELCAFIDEVADILVQVVNQIADTLIESVETVAKTVLHVINTALALSEFMMQAGLQVALAAMSGDWGELLLFVIQSAVGIAGISEDEFESYFGADPDVLQTVVDDPGGFIGRFGEAFGMGFSQFGDNFGSHLKTGFFEWLTGAMAGADIVIPETWDFKGIMQLVLSVLGVSMGGIRAKIKEFFGEKTAKIVDMLIDYGKAFKEDGLKGVIREVSLDMTGAVREEVIDKAAEEVGTGGGLLDSLLDLLDAFANGDGLEALIDFARDDLGGILKGLVVDSIVNVVLEQVIKQGILKLASLFNPVSALVQMLITAWEAFQSIKQNMDRIQSVLLSVVEGIIDIVIGNLSTVADRIEEALADLIPVAIDMLASILGLGKIDDKISNALEGLRGTVDGLLDKLFKAIRGAVDGLIETVRGWFDNNPDEEGDGEADGSLMDPMGLSAGGGVVTYWVEAEDGTLQRVVQGDPAAMTQAWGQGVAGRVAPGGSGETAYPEGGWQPSGTSDLAGSAAVTASVADSGDATFEPGSLETAAQSPAAYISEFAAAAPSVQAATWPEVGAEVGSLNADNVTAIDGSLAPVAAQLPGEAAGVTPDTSLEVVGAAPSVGVQAPDIESVPLPDLGPAPSGDLSALADALPAAPDLVHAANVDAGALAAAASTGVGSARAATAALEGRMGSVVDDDAIVPIGVDTQAEMAGLGQAATPTTDAVGGIDVYASLSLPQEVHAQFDDMLRAESADALAPAEAELGAAEQTRDEDVVGAMSQVDLDAKGLVEQAGLDRVGAMDEQRGRIAGAHEAALTEQQAQLADLEGQLDEERSARMSEVDVRLHDDQLRLDSAYDGAKSEAASALTSAEASAEDAQKETEDPGWFDRLADYAQQAVDWLSDTISGIFDGLREAVSSIFDAVTAVASQIIEDAATFVTDAITSFGAVVQGAIQAFLGDVLPDLANRLCEVVNDAVNAANDAMDTIATGLVDNIQGLATALEAGLNGLIDVYDAGVQGALNVAQFALDFTWQDIVVRAIEATLFLAGIESEDFWAMVGRAETTLRAILDDPGAFVSNAINAMSQGFGQFGDNFLDHLQAGFLDWLGGNLGDVTMPDTLDLPGVLDMTLQVLGLDRDGLREKAEERLGSGTVEVFDYAWGAVDALIAGGLSGLWEEVQADLGDLWDVVVGGMQEWLLETVVMAAVGKLAAMFTPVGALVQAIQVVWEVYEYLQERAAELMAVVDAWVESLADIANGSISGAADRIEGALAATVSPAIDLLARVLNLSGLGDRITEIIEGARERVDEAIDALLARIVGTFTASDGDTSGGEQTSGGEPVDPQAEAAAAKLRDQALKAHLDAMEEYWADGDEDAELDDLRAFAEARRASVESTLPSVAGSPATELVTHLVDDGGAVEAEALITATTAKKRRRILRSAEHDILRVAVKDAGVVPFLTSIAAGRSVGLYQYEWFSMPDHAGSYDAIDAVTGKPENRNFVKTQFRAIDKGSHEWIPCSLLDDIVIGAHSPESAAKAGRWLALADDLRSPTSDLVFQPEPQPWLSDLVVTAKNTLEPDQTVEARMEALLEENEVSARNLDITGHVGAIRLDGKNKPGGSHQFHEALVALWSFDQDPATYPGRVANFVQSDAGLWGGSASELIPADFEPFAHLVSSTYTDKTGASWGSNLGALMGEVLDRFFGVLDNLRRAIGKR